MLPHEAGLALAARLAQPHFHALVQRCRIGIQVAGHRRRRADADGLNRLDARRNQAITHRFGAFTGEGAVLGIVAGHATIAEQDHVLLAERRLLHLADKTRQVGFRSGIQGVGAGLEVEGHRHAVRAGDRLFKGAHVGGTHPGAPAIHGVAHGIQTIGGIVGVRHARLQIGQTGLRGGELACRPERQLQEILRGRGERPVRRDREKMLAGQRIFVGLDAEKARLDARAAIGRQRYGAGAVNGRPAPRSGDADLPGRASLADRRAAFDSARAAAGAKRAHHDEGDDDDDGGGGFESDDPAYTAAAAAASRKKAARGAAFAPAPLHPPLAPEAPDGPRGLTREVATNRGLTPHRRKDLKNPRVKGRKRFAKAQVRRGGQVVTAKPAAGPYGGEATGIRSRLSKSTRF